ncbi:MAG: type II secretion system protein GspG [Planctomycetes bacterium]|nr:type II secretion system protein GspG [Planctomycetota bacterium]
MITYAFLLAVVPQAPAEHATLHPQGAFAYAEIPDVKAMLGAYQKAPIVQLVRDESVRKVVYGVFESFDIDLDEHLAQLGAQLGLPTDQATSPVTSLVAYLARLRSASISMTFRPNGDSAPLQASGTTIGEIAQIAVAIQRFENENGELPEKLADLELADALRNDAWNHPYAYTHKPDGTYTLASFGADGKPGGEGANADIEHGKEDEAGKRMAEGLATQLGVLTVLRFDDAANAKWAHDLFVLGTSKVEVKGSTPTAVKYRGANGSLERWSAPADIEFPVWTIVTDKDFVIGAGVMTPETATELSNGQGTSLAALPKFKELPGRLPAAQGVPIGRMFMQTEGMMQLAYQGGPQTEALRELLERAGGETFGRMNLVGERFITELVSTPSSKDYFGKSMGQKPVPTDLWKCIPDDAIAFYGTSIDGAALYKELMITLTAEGNDLESRVKELEEKHGINLERDLFANLEGGAVGYILAIKGVPPGMAMIAELKDAEAFTRGMRSLLKLVSEQEGIPFSIKENPYKYKDVECPKWTFSFKDGGDASGFGGVMTPTPTVAVVKNRVVLTLFSTRATKEIKRLLGDEAAPHPLLASPSRPPANATLVGYMDWAEFIGGIYKTALGFASMMPGMTGPDAKFDVSKLPDAAVFTHFFKPTVLYCTHIDGGMYTHMESSFGPETWVAFVGGIGATAFIANARATEVVTVPEEPEEADEPDEPDAPSAEVLSSQIALASIETALAVFKVDTGKLPASLDELAKPTKNYPKGFFNGGALPKDGWGHAYRYAPSADKTSYRVWSIGADGVDQNGAGDDVASE